jgi:RimJ/RimL family protein N-acetyltransferase
MSPPALLETPRLILRPLGEADAPKLFAMSRESGLRRWLPDQVYADEAEALAVARLLAAKFGAPGGPAAAPHVFGVCLREGDELIGHVGLSPLRGEVEVGYAIEERRQGRGLASEAVRAAAEWGVQRFGLARILGIVAPANAASCRVLERAGFGLVGEAMGRLHGRDALVRTYQLVR